MPERPDQEGHGGDRYYLRTDSEDHYGMTQYVPVNTEEEDILVVDEDGVPITRDEYLEIIQMDQKGIDEGMAMTLDGNEEMIAVVDERGNAITIPIDGSMELNEQGEPVAQVDEVRGSQDLKREQHGEDNEARKLSDDERNSAQRV